MKKIKSFRYLLIYFLFAVIIGFVACKQTSKDENSKNNSIKKPFASYNHTALVVKNLDSSVKFYHDVFEFDTIHYPFPYRENISAKWMSTGNGEELHLGKFKGDTTRYDCPGHIGFTVSSIDTVLARLKKLNYTLPEIGNMPNGERTVEFTDIDGNKIHMIERK